METSRVEYMAQKQNRIAQHLLNDKIGEIDKQFTLTKLTHRMFIKQLRYDMSQFRNSTGHSPLARPPTGEEDTRNIKKRALPLSKLSKGRKSLGGVRDHPISSEVEATSRVTQSVDSFFLTEQDGGEGNEDEVDISELSGISQNVRSPKVTHTTGKDISHSEPRRKRSSIDTLVRIAEANRVVKMPSVFQTSAIKSKQGLQTLSRFLPPIAVTSNARSTNEHTGSPLEAGTTNLSSTKVSSSEADDVPLSGDHVNGVRVSFTPKVKEKAANKDREAKKPGIDKILKLSLRRASEQRKADERQQQRRKLQAKLAIEEPFGLYRPENMKLINKIFKQEELHNQHKELLEENISKSALPVPTRVGVSKLEGKLEAFLKSS